MKKYLLLLLILTSINNLVLSQIVVIDPGHGYCSDCTQNCTSSVRTDLEILTAMSVSNKLNTILASCTNITSHLTRLTSNCGDFPSLYQRSVMSNNWLADRFLSVHCNGGGGNGTETFWCNNSSSSNASCQTFATEIQNQMVTHGYWNDRRVVEDATYLPYHLGVLSGTNAIGCLSEIGFVDYTPNATKLANNAWRDSFALAYKYALENELNYTCTTNSGCIADAYEPNNSTATANDLTNQTINLTALCITANDNDYFKVTHSNSAVTEYYVRVKGNNSASVGAYNLTVQSVGNDLEIETHSHLGSTTDTYLYLYDANGNFLASDDDGGVNGFSKISYAVQSAATPPDMVIENLYTSPAVVTVGQAIDLYVDMKNIGQTVANNISLDYRIDGTIVGTDSHTSLAAAQSQTEFFSSHTFNTTGTYQYCVYIAPVSGEVNILNSSYCTNVTVTNTVSTCTTDAYESNNSIATANDFTNQTVNLSNLCITAADEDFFKVTHVNNSTMIYYVKVNGYNATTTGLYDLTVQSIGNDLVIETHPNGSSNTDTYLTLFDGSGTSLATDDDGGVSVLSKITYNVPAPVNTEDITVSNISLNINSSIEGGSFTASCDQDYAGVQLVSNLPLIDLDYYLSTDCNLDASDILLGSDVSSIGSDDLSDAESETLTIPLGTSSGNYYILFASDNDDEILEVNENNNVACIAFTVIDHTYDGFSSNVNISVTTGPIGTTVPISSTINLTTTNTNSTNVGQFWYFSNDCYIDASDIHMGNQGIGLDVNNPSYNQSTNLTIPNNVNPGNYNILFVIDRYDNIMETNENNNIVCVPFTVTGPVISCPDVYEPNETNQTASSLGSYSSPVSLVGLCLTSQDVDIYKITVNSNDYFIKVNGNTTTISGDYNLDISLTNSILNIQTSSYLGSSTDTYLELFDANYNSLAVNNNENGTSLFSLIDFDISTVVNTIIDCGADYLENNNSASTSSVITSPNNFANNSPLCISAGDEDYFSFDYNGNTFYILCEGYDNQSVGRYNISVTLNASNLTVETLAEAGELTDTYLTVFDSNLNDIDSDDDSGANFLSKVIVPLYNLTNKTVGINEIVNDKEFKLYPNPTNNFINIRSRDNIDSYEIYNLNGQLLKSDFGIYTTECKINVSEFAQGLYFMVATVDGERITNKFTKR